jgi:hypothetical protein
MREYRICTVGQDGRSISSRTFTAGNDDDAIVWAQQQIKDQSVELWSGPRLVQRFEPPEKNRTAEAVSHRIEQGRMVPKRKT